MKRIWKRVLLVLSLLALILVLTVPLYFFTPAQIVSKFGVNHSLIALFFVSFFGGLSAGGMVSFVAMILTLTAGGINPLFVGLVAGTALTIGDLIVFSLGRKSRELVKGEAHERLNKLSKFLQKRSKGYIRFFIYVYIGLLPFPNDILTLSLAVIEYPRRKIWLPLALGDLTFALGVAYLGGAFLI